MGRVWHRRLWRPPVGAYGRAAGTLGLVPMEKSWRGPPVPRVLASLAPWSPHSSRPPSPPAQDSPRPTFSSSAFCQRRKMRRKQRSRAPKEVKKCCRRERCVSPGGETRLEGGGSSTRCTLFPALHADVCNHSSLPSFHRISVLCPAQHWMTLESPRCGDGPRPRPQGSQSRAHSPNWLGCLGEAQGTFPVSYAHSGWPTDPLLAKKTQREVCLKSSRPISFSSPVWATGVRQPSWMDPEATIMIHGASGKASRWRRPLS